MAPLFLPLPLALALLLCPIAAASGCRDARPAPEKRAFRSAAVDAAIERVASSMADKELACLFRNTLPSTLDTTIFRHLPANSSRPQGSCAQTPGQCGSRDCDTDEDDTFVVTGDIQAMWLRDSMNQVMPYIRYAPRDKQLQQLLRGVLNRQARQIRTDVWANAHKLDPQSPSEHSDDLTTRQSYLGTAVNAMTPMIFERKYELDSLMSFLKLGSEYFAVTQDATPFNDRWLEAVGMVLQAVKAMQSSSANDASGYSFQRQTTEPSDTLLHGRGNPGAATGMVRSMFRPSDDATVFPFLVPANAMTVVELRRCAALLRALPAAPAPAAAPRTALAKELEQVSGVIEAAIWKHGVVMHPTGQKVFAYEVDGHGNALHMDDGNVPSLLSLPYLGFVNASNEVYLATRRVVLSTATNPWYFEGSVAKGVGSPHTGLDRVWPLALMVQALTATSQDEVRVLLNTLKSTTADTRVMHESIDRDDAGSFTRAWFAWANSLFGELVLRLFEKSPQLLAAGSVYT